MKYTRDREFNPCGGETNSGYFTPYDPRKVSLLCRFEHSFYFSRLRVSLNFNLIRRALRQLQEMFYSISSECFRRKIETEGYVACWLNRRTWYRDKQIREVYQLFPLTCSSFTLLMLKLYYNCFTDFLNTKSVSSYQVILISSTLFA